MGFSETARGRTEDPRLKRPLLYRLSYSLVNIFISKTVVVTTILHNLYYKL